jgi:hypothetical protein
MKVSDFHITHLSHVCISKEDSKQEHREELLATCKKSYSRYGVKIGENFDQSWGGLPVVIFLGDDVQLSPVLDSPVYNSSCKLPAALHGVLVWNLPLKYKHVIGG